ncbi:MAG: HAD-IA family hydrolase, partial [Pseudomonadota bacterium]
VIGKQQRRAMFAEVDLHGMNNDVDLGHPWKETVLGCAAAHPMWQREITLWYDRWIEMAVPVLERSLRCLRALRAKGVPVFALSNFGVESFAYAETQYPLLGEFDRRYISGHLKMVKPDAAIYKYVETDSGIAPGRLLFADDRADNIAAAEARGWQVHLFDGEAGWAERLVSEGLLTQGEAA